MTWLRQSGYRALPSKFLQQSLIRLVASGILVRWHLLGRLGRLTDLFGLRAVTLS